MMEVLFERQLNNIPFFYLPSPLKSLLLKHPVSSSGDAINDLYY